MRKLQLVQDWLGQRLNNRLLAALVAVLAVAVAFQLA
jgi:hypothetical protein